MLIKWTAAKEGTEEKGNHCNDKGTNIEWKRHNLRGDSTQKKSNGKRSKLANEREKNKTSVHFCCKWLSGERKWYSAQDMQKELNLCHPPQSLKDYVMEKTLA